ncbi:MAG TPA: hypothetical protein VKV95_06600 [Terriglobia bacterium]|nr:hypothetical protein [Terriglobia bacterium]
MVCPSCGKHVGATEALCGFCGAALQRGAPPSTDAGSPGGGSALGTSGKMALQRRVATACLLLGLFSLAAVPVVFAVLNIVPPQPWEHEVLNRVLGTIAGVLGMSAILSGILALVLGGLAKVRFRRIERTPFGADRTRRGMILGAIGAGIWICLIAIITLQKSHIGESVSPVGTLHTINTAAITYSSQYRHGFPLRLSYLGYDPSKEDDQAAGLIDEMLASGTKAGYRFYYVAGPVDSQGMVLTYAVHADPVDPSGGHPYYFTDQTGVVRHESKWEANVSSPPLD